MWHSHIPYIWSATHYQEVSTVRLRHEQGHGVYFMGFDVEVCIYREYCGLKYYKHENEDEEVMAQLYEYLSCTRHCVMPESQNKPTFTISVCEELRTQRK